MSQGLISLLLLGSWTGARLWWALPLLVATSLVYSATRFELTRDILHGAVRSFIWGALFMSAIYAVVWLVC